MKGRRWWPFRKRYFFFIRFSWWDGDVMLEVQANEVDQIIINNSYYYSVLEIQVH
jgi:hypothetical protein